MFRPILCALVLAGCMPTPALAQTADHVLEAKIAMAQADLDRLHRRELMAINSGDLAAMNRFQFDSNRLTFELTQLREAAIESDISRPTYEEKRAAFDAFETRQARQDADRAVVAARQAVDLADADERITAAADAEAH